MSKKSVFEGQKTYVKGDWLLESLLLMLYVEKKLKDQKREKFQFFRVEIQVIRLSETERWNLLCQSLEKNRSNSTLCQAGAKLTTESSTDK